MKKERSGQAPLPLAKKNLILIRTEGMGSWIKLAPDVDGFYPISASQGTLEQLMIMEQVLVERKNISEWDSNSGSDTYWLCNFK